MDTVDSQERTGLRISQHRREHFPLTLEVTLSVCSQRRQYLMILDTQRVNKVTQYEAEALNAARNVEWPLVIG